LEVFHLTQPDQHASTVILVTNNGMGKADVELQQTLLSTFLSLVDEHSYLPAAICFYTEGVKLVVEESPVLIQLKSLESKGVRLIVCQTCLKYFHLADKVQVGIVGGMTDILEAQWMADKVITL
jgi:intracellular sulfur oxidation DsrE/DsrF family protein